MMKQSLMPQWDLQRMRVGVGIRLLEALPANRLDEHPIPGMRTPKELAVHTFGFMPVAIDGLLAGTLANFDEAAAVAGIRDRDALVAFARDAWARADAGFGKVTDAQLAATVPTPWGQSYPGIAIFGFIPDEFLHHRGQMFAYLRAQGVEPPFNWDFEGSAPEFQPRQAAAN